jgi:AcrR family transcriptional regulator
VAHARVVGDPPDAFPAEDTRSRILDVARELFATHGFAKTSTRELSERLGFTKAALYYHFRTKDELLAALVEPAIAELRRLLDQAPDRITTPVRRMALEGYVDLVAANQDLVRVISQDPAALQSPALADVPVVYDRLMRLLSGSDNPGVVELTRSRAALACVDAGMSRAAETDDMDSVRYATVLAACGALGIPAPRTSLAEDLS